MFVCVLSFSNVDYFYLTEHITILLMFYDFFFGGGAASKRPPGIKSTPPALEGEILITGPPGKYLFFF